MKAFILDLSKVPKSEGGYPLWEWKDKAEQLLFDLGYSYALMSSTEALLNALYAALIERQLKEPGTRELREELGELLLKLKDFREHRLSDRDEIYRAGYLAGAKLDPGKN
jgi:hypothetical protein